MTSISDRASYRLDIDGLRAIAVLAVIAFHYGSKAISGGFVGVDVFFVISGFLITTQIVASIERQQFSILAFYDRRLRRILPATLVMIAVCLAFGYWALLPGDYEDLARSAAWSSLGLVNFYLYQQSDYFGPAASFMPLLHTWSLAVEEQFYFVWPYTLVLVMWAARGSKMITFALLAAVAAISVALSVVLVGENQPLAFYMLPTRAWELAAGGLVALLPVLQRAVLAEVMAAVGACLVIGSMTLISSDSSFPGVNAIPPVLGAALIVIATSSRTQVAKLLALPPLVFVGRISFSLYLWHWPILVFYRYLQYGRFPRPHIALLLCLGAFVVATASYYLIEQPFRRLRPKKSSTIFASAATVGAMAMAASLIVVADGLPFRYSQQALAYFEFKAPPMMAAGKERCFAGRAEWDESACLEISATRPNVLLVGDSHAAHFAVALNKVFPEVSLSIATASRCLPIPPFSGMQRCTNLMQDVFGRVIKQHAFDAVIISARWLPESSDALAETVKLLSPWVRHVVILGPNIEYAQHLPSLLGRAVDAPNARIIERATNRQVWATDAKIGTSLQGTGAKFFSILDATCPDHQCPTLDKAGKPIIYDASHYTSEGATEVLTALRAKGLLAETLSKAPLDPAVATSTP